jgi:uncharacterized protein YbjT (DUF2867 family)
MEKKTNAVTGAFSYTGKYITRSLLAQGHDVITLTSNLNRPNPFENQIKAYPFNFDNPDSLVKTLTGIDTLFNTYWVRFDHGDKSFDQAVANTKTLFQAAKIAGVRRVLHISVSNPVLDSPLPYFAGKARLERILLESGLSYAVLRPTLIFGKEDILINNIAWLLRRFPVFAVPGNGNYHLQPIDVEDLADLAVQAGEMNDNLIWDAAGPEIFSFEGLIQAIAKTLGRHPWVVHLPPGIALALTRLISTFLGDVMLTRSELDGLMADLLVSAEAPRGKKSFRAWLQENRKTIGQRYASEIARHFKT